MRWYAYHAYVAERKEIKEGREDLVKSRSHEIGTLNCRIALKFDRHIGSTAAEVPVKFQSDRTILNTNLATSRLFEILRKDVFPDIETGPRKREECCAFPYTTHHLGKHSDIIIASYSSFEKEQPTSLNADMVFFRLQWSFFLVRRWQKAFCLI